MARQSRLGPLTLAAGGVLAVMGATAFTAGNTVGDQSFGQGVGVVSGFTVSNVVYTLGTSATDVPDPRALGVSFHIERTDTSTFASVLPTNATVKVRVNLGGTYTTPIVCDLSPVGNSATCNLNSVTVRASQMEGLSVLAFDTLPEA